MSIVCGRNSGFRDFDISTWRYNVISLFRYYVNLQFSIFNRLPSGRMGGGRYSVGKSTDLLSLPQLIGQLFGLVVQNAYLCAC